jgi:endo-alpha-1,4-polygalactosaminidase (GH114 family)
MSDDKHIVLKKRLYLKQRMDLWIYCINYYKTYNNEVNDPRIKAVWEWGQQEGCIGLSNENT